MKAISIFTIIVTFSLASGNPVCPEPEEISPCTCKIVAYGVHVVCAYQKSIPVLQRNFKVLTTYHVDNLLLHGLNFSDTVPDDMFAGMNVNALQIEKSRMIFAGKAFNGLDNTLRKLNVMDCSVVGKNFAMARLSNLNDIQFRANKFEVITRKWLKDSIPNVSSLNLDNNEIRSIEEGAFVNLSVLKDISLADNRISKISRNIFPIPADKLTRIDLSHNELTSLPTDLFTQMPNLASVVLSGNDLRSIPEATWSQIWNQVNAVLLYENSIVCDERIQWIKEKRKPKQLEGTCAEPNAMKGKPLSMVLQK